MSRCTLIINADDFGYEPQVSKGILEAMVDGVVSSTTMMVNGPHAEHAAQLARGKHLAIGLHLNLARWSPRSQLPDGLLSPHGEFDEARAGELSAEQVRREVDAQLMRLESLLGQSATHIDVHKHLHRHPAVLDGLCLAAVTHRLPVRSIDAAMRATLVSRGVATNDHFIGDAGATAYWSMPQFEHDIAALPRSGRVELMCHPGYAPQAVTSGYSAQREVELRTFCNPTARAVLERAGVLPVRTWKDVPQP